MQKAIIRIKEVELYNIKNVEYGKVNFQNSQTSSGKLFSSEIIGIYGQNGSGKTAFVDAMCLVQRLLSGRPLPENAVDFIHKNRNSATIKLVFSLDVKDYRYQIFYDVEIEKNSENRATVISEKLSYKEFVDNAWKTKAGIIDYQIRNKEYVFTPQKNYRLLTSDKNDVSPIDLGVARKMSEKSGTSFIFSGEMEELIQKSEEFEKYTTIILSLKHYAAVNLFIIKNELSGMITMNMLLPFSYRIHSEGKFSQGKLPIGLMEPTVVHEDIFDVVKKFVDQMNIVLGQIVPGLNIGIKNYGRQLKENGAEGVRIELISIRDDIQIPLKYESDGIKKIISILSSLITMFNNQSVCMIVDELDAGVFEYLLGEMLQILYESGKGQLIFTSHNLRPLEMLDTNSIVFTTTNPENRYIRFTNVKTNNNLRDLYYRSIHLGGQKEEVYKETNSFNISRAFRKAEKVGRMIDEN
jgi:AAA15 family ATPase/GTPase